MTKSAKTLTGNYQYNGIDKVILPWSVSQIQHTQQYKVRASVFGGLLNRKRKLMKWKLTTNYQTIYYPKPKSYYGHTIIFILYSSNL